MQNQTRPHGDQQQERRNGPEPIASERVEAPEERKTFFLDMLENERGRVLRVKERAGKTSTVMIPASKLREVAELMLQMANWNDKNP